MLRKNVATAMTLALALSGCSTLRQSPGACKALTTLTGATIGAVGGGVGTHNIEKGPSKGEDAAGAAAGLVAGSLVGFLVGHAICEEAPPPPPPPVAAPAPMPKGQKILQLEGANFDFNKSTLKPAGRSRVAEAAKTLRDNPSVNVAVEGHTDSIGSDAYNNKLSQRRAQTVADTLAKDGVARSRMSVKGYGKSKPIADNKTESGRAKNRRVEIVVE